MKLCQGVLLADVLIITNEMISRLLMCACVCFDWNSMTKKWWFLCLYEICYVCFCWKIHMFKCHVVMDLLRNDQGRIWGSCQVCCFLLGTCFGCGDLILGCRFGDFEGSYCSACGGSFQICRSGYGFQDFGDGYPAETWDNSSSMDEKFLIHW